MQNHIFLSLRNLVIITVWNCYIYDENSRPCEHNARETLSNEYLENLWTIL